MGTRKPKMTTKTGLPLSDEWADGRHEVTALERARVATADLLAEGGIDWNEDGVGNDRENQMRCASAVVDVQRVEWERAVNADGVSVRRYVARSPWEVDPDVH